MTLKVMEFNIEYGGTTVDFAKVVEAVRATDPDVVGLEEAETNTGRLARAHARARPPPNAGRARSRGASPE